MTNLRKSHMGDSDSHVVSVAASADSMYAAYGLLLGMLVVPQFILIHHYLHLLIMAPLLVWIGCQRALGEALKAPGESQARRAPQSWDSMHSVAHQVPCLPS